MAVYQSENIFPREKDLTITEYNYSYQLYGILEDSEIDLTDYLVNVRILSNFLSNVFPIVAIKLILTKSEYLEIQKYSDTILFRLNIERYQTLTDYPETLAENQYEDIILKPIDLKKELVDPVNALSAEEGSEIADNMAQYELNLFLFSKDHLFFNKYLNSYIFSECTLADVLLYLFNSNYQNSKMRLYIGKLDNEKEYRQIIIPNLNLVDSLKYLQNVYGLFNNGLQIFIDFNNFYIVDSLKVIESDVENDYPKAVIELYSELEKERVNYSSTNMMYRDTENQVYLIRTTNKPQMVSPSTSKKELIGERVTILSNASDGSTNKNCLDMTFTKESNDPRRPKETFYWNNFSSPMVESSFKAAHSKSFDAICLIFNNADIEAFSTNRRYFIVDKTDGFSQDIEGEYKLAELNIISEMSSGNAGKALATVRAVFTRIINTE